MSQCKTGICKLCNKRFKQFQGRNRTRCNTCNTNIRRLRQKIAAIKLLGGKCVKCGYDRHPAAMEFHHRDGEKKEFEIGGIANKKWSIIKKELLKCNLLCSNCHRIEHSTRFDNEALVKEAQKYDMSKLV